MDEAWHEPGGAACVDTRRRFCETGDREAGANMGEIWSHRVDGEAFERLVVEANRVLMSTKEETLIVDRDGAVLGRRLRRETDPAPGYSLPRVGEFGYALEDGALLQFAADETLVSRTPIPLDLFARHRDPLRRWFRNPTDEHVSAMIDAKISEWYRGVYLCADPARGRLLAIGMSNPPWLVRLRTDGTVDWVLIVGRFTDCCNWAGVVSRDGALVHVSSCGKRVTFITAAGEIVSAHDLPDCPIGLSTEGRDVAYVTFWDEGVAAYRPNQGHIGSVDIPGLRAAEVRDGVVYCVTEDPAAGVLLKAFRQPPFG
jgi:hypothetical protein